MANYQCVLGVHSYVNHAKFNNQLSRNHKIISLQAKKQLACRIALVIHLAKIQASENEGEQ